MVNVPAAEKALSASTDVGGAVNRYEYTVCTADPRLPVLSCNANSAFMAFLRCLLAFVGL